MSQRKSMFSFVCFIVLWVLLPASWAQSPSHGKAQPKPTSGKNPSRIPASDTTARLQSQAAAEAAVAARLQSSALPVATTAPAILAPVAASMETEAVPGPVPVVQPRAELVPMPSAPHPHQQELWIAQQIHVGHLPCELGASVRIEADPAQPGYFKVHAKGIKYRMFPVQTSTGALRLEDKKAGAVWLQLANKSMLMDQKRGRRLADECAHPDQVAVAQSMKTNPPPSLIDTRGMGR